ncbi:MAG TPA: exo-beta-N-acetylmuramidase NamZ domain-containing protein [Chitinophagaceae bacterium]|nr:exo-beta-N-acetylmuramidase NamZ domain-containing protein [Chitinophagaceae bacterium]
MKKAHLFTIVPALSCLIACSQITTTQPSNPITKQTDNSSIKPAAERIDVYLPMIKGKRIGIFANHTSTVGKSHLVDTLLKLGINVVVAFGPEHGFRGDTPDGIKINDYKDEKTGVKIISLYGSKRRPAPEDVKDVDILVFDIQDVGTRFYTYISSMQEFLEFALENHKPLIIFDRPNPNGYFVDGPVLDMKYKSFIGMQPIPINYGMTMAEYANMLLGEKMLSAKANEIHAYNITTKPTTDTPFHVQFIKNEGYTHKSKYVLPVPPSPNLPNMQSVYLYPSTCLFEGTSLSEGRGTDKQFQVFGHPDLPKNLYSFTPNPNAASKSSKHFGKVCYGWYIQGTPEEILKQVDGKIQLKWLMEAYRLFPNKDSFFLKGNSFELRAGTDQLKQQIKDGKSEQEIRKSWEPKLSGFKAVRKKYLLYEDFE